MKKKNKHLFSPTPSVVKRGTVAMLCLMLTGLFLVAGCKKDDPVISGGSGTGGEGEEPEYPIEVPLTEYFLGETFYRYWINLDYDEQVMVINSTEQLEYYIFCDANDNPSSKYPPVDFSKNDLLLVSGRAESGASYVMKKLQQLSPNEYELDMEVILNTDKPKKEWVFAFLVEKWNQENAIALKVKTTDGETDFFYQGNGEKEYFTIRKDQVIIQCESEEKAKALCENPIFISTFTISYIWVLAIIDPLQVKLDDILRIPDVVSATYGLEYADGTLQWTKNRISVAFKDGLSPEEVLNEVGLIESVETIELFNPYSTIYHITLNVQLGDILPICRDLFKSGMCVFAEPSFIRQLIVH